MTWKHATVFYLSLALCSGYSSGVSTAEGDNFHSDDRPLATTFVYDCNGYQFVTRLGPGEMALWLEDRYLILSQVRSASGTLYEEGDISFWSKGQAAMLTVAGQVHSNCRLVADRAPWEDARRRGVDFRAAGNEPGWYLEIEDGRQLLFVGDYGELRVELENPASTVEGDTLVYEFSTALQALRVEITEQHCIDSMRGNAFSRSVDVTLNGNYYHGCGQALN
jgi:membrane-bound inhibitor of C-type lysozyme